MILAIAVTAISLTMLQATINAPREAFRQCARSAADSARSENVAGDAFEAYMRNSCSAEIGSLRGAIQAFNMKNGMAKKAAAEDAALTADDYAAGPIEKYRSRTAAALPAAAPIEPPQP